MGQFGPESDVWRASCVWVLVQALNGEDLASVNLCLTPHFEPLRWVRVVAQKLEHSSVTVKCGSIES